MSYQIVPFFLLIGSGFGIVLLIGRKWRQLTVLDVANIPEVRQAKKKDELLKKRMENLALAAKARRMAAWWTPLWQRWRVWQRRFRHYVVRIEGQMAAQAERLRTDESLRSRDERMGETRKLVSDGTFALEQGDTDLAEKHFLAAIRLERKNSAAYRGLAEVYQRAGHTGEAEETYRFLLRLDPNDDGIYVKLAELSEQRGDLPAAVQYYQQAVLVNDNLSGRFAKLAELLTTLGQYETAIEAAKQAVELEPQNPKYLDSLIEIAILAADRRAAEEAWTRLRMVNPDNQKLPALKEKIEAL